MPCRGCRGVPWVPWVPCSGCCSLFRLGQSRLSPCAPAEQGRAASGLQRARAVALRSLCDCRGERRVLLPRPARATTVNPDIVSITFQSHLKGTKVSETSVNVQESDRVRLFALAVVRSGAQPSSVRPHTGWNKQVAFFISGSLNCPFNVCKLFEPVKDWFGNNVQPDFPPQHTQQSKHTNNPSAH